MKIFSTAVLKISRQVLILKKNSPHIFFVAGVAGTIASTVLACRATLKLSDTLDEMKNEIASLKNPSDESEWTTQLIAEHNKEFNDNPATESAVTLYVYSRASLKLVKLYGPSVLLGAASIGMLTGSHIQLTRRNSALMAAYAAVQKAYDEYRERVRELVGDEKELDIYHAVETKTLKCEDDNELTVKVADPNKYSPYAKFFDEYSRFWQRDPELNRLFVQVQQNYFNYRLNNYGHVFLNEVYDALGVERSRAASVVGWLKDGDGDGYIDFGIFEAFNRNFVNGSERSILLDFNVDGVIYDKI